MFPMIMDLPEGFNPSLLKVPLRLAMRKAKQIARDKYGSLISKCGMAKTWEECLSGWLKAPNLLDLLFYYNVGNMTHAVRVQVQINKIGQDCTEDDIICQLL